MTLVQQFEFRQFLPLVGVILTMAVLQAQGTILRADLQRVRGSSHARSLARLECAGLGVTPSKGSKNLNARRPE
jgi:hypothetical protein